MSLQEKSAQTISEEISGLNEKMLSNYSKIEVLQELVSDLLYDNERFKAAIKERENQLQLRAKQKR